MAPNAGKHKLEWNTPSANHQLSQDRGFEARRREREASPMARPHDPSTRPGWHHAWS